MISRQQRTNRQRLRPNFLRLRNIFFQRNPKNKHLPLRDNLRRPRLLRIGQPIQLQKHSNAYLLQKKQEKKSCELKRRDISGDKSVNSLLRKNILNRLPLSQVNSFNYPQIRPNILPGVQLPGNGASQRSFNNRKLHLSR